MLDFWYFMVILFIIILGFGVFFQALMYPNQSLDWFLIENVFFPSFMVLGGENDIANQMLRSIKF